MLFLKLGENLNSETQKYEKFLQRPTCEDKIQKSVFPVKSKSAKENKMFIK